MEQQAVVTPREAVSPSSTVPLGGYDDASLDAKGRLLLAINQRAVLREGYAVGISEFGCIQIFPKSRWQSEREKILAIDPENKFYTRYYHMTIGRTHENEKFDTAERILLPAMMREEFKLPAKVMVVGNVNRFLILTPEEFKAFNRNPIEFRQLEVEAYFNLKDAMMMIEGSKRLSNGGST